jgi:hypothetical protein
MRDTNQSRLWALVEQSHRSDSDEGGDQGRQERGRSNQTSSADSAARLGISGESFDQNQDRFRGARYSGPFSALLPRWWRARIEALREPKVELGEENGEEPAPPLALEGIERAICRSCGRPGVVRACDICRQGAHIEHTLVSREQLRPAWAEPPLVCFACIEEGRAEDQSFGAGSQSIVGALKRGEWSS